MNIEPRLPPVQLIHRYKQRFPPFFFQPKLGRLCLVDGLVGCYRNKLFSGPRRPHGNSARFGPDAMRLISTASAIWSPTMVYVGEELRRYEPTTTTLRGTRSPGAAPAIGDWYGHTAAHPCRHAAASWGTSAGAQGRIRHLGNGFSFELKLGSSMFE